MKKQQSKTRVRGKCQISLLWLSVLFSSQVTLAQNKVVVIPMVGDDIPAISHPVADTFTNSIGMQFNTLPAGSFTMGSPSGICPFICTIAEPGRDSDEVQHTVALSKAFKMQTTEVTNAQWNAVIVNSLLGSNPSSSHTEDNYPVETVSWYDAIFFANRLSLDEGRSVCYSTSGVSGTPGTGSLSISTVTQNASCTGYRLPTEAEWEYAARAGTTTAYANPVGFDAADTETLSGFNGNLHAMGWYRYNREMQNGSSVSAYANGTKPVAKKQANAWGLYDTHGNVFEWNWDWYAAYSGNPTDPVGPASGSLRVIRGGSWDFSASFARSADRINASPSIRLFTLGFRLVLPQVQ